MAKKLSGKTAEKPTDLPLYLFHQGTNYNAYDYMGAHFTRPYSRKRYKSCLDGTDKAVNR